MKKYVAYYNRKTRKLEKIYIKNTYYWCGFFSFVSPSSDYTGHLRFWLQKYLGRNWRELFTRKKLTVIIFRNFMKLSRWERKMKIWENCNANGKMTKNKCVSYWTRDILSWSLEEKLHVLVQYNSRCKFIPIDSVMAGCNMSCSEKKRVLRMRVFCTERERAEFKSQK